MPAGRPRAIKEKLELNGLAKAKPGRYKDRAETKDLSLTLVQDIDPPKEYLADTKKAWESIVPELLNLKILSQADLPSLKILFDCYELYVKYYKQEKKLSTSINFTNSSDVKLLKQVSSLRKSAYDDFVRMSARYGLTPVDRTRLVLEKEEPKTEDPLDIVIGGTQ